MHLEAKLLGRVQARKDRTLKTEYWDQKFYVKIETSEGNVIYKVKTLQTKNKSFWEQSFVDTRQRPNRVCNAMHAKVKQERAQGGCLGTKSRWKTW